VSNIFAVPGKDYLNENHILRKFETKNDLNGKYIKLNFLKRNVWKIS
jgi:hypothetical protein